MPVKDSIKTKTPAAKDPGVKENSKQNGKQENKKKQEMPKFIPGLELNRMFFHDVVAPLMQQHFPDLPYSAGLVGDGSDVLGFDSPTSMDHNWGPRMCIFFKKDDFEFWSGEVDKMLRRNLPYTYKGFSTNFTKEDPNAYLKQTPVYIHEGEVNHLFKFYTVKSFMRHYLGFDRDDEIKIEDWLTFPESSLLEITAGEIYYDGLDELNKLREKLAYYPHDIWLYMIRVQWGKIYNELTFQSRSGDEGDELGSRVLAARSIEMVIKMSFLLERKYMPYLKWMGTAFHRLPLAKKLTPLLIKIQDEKDWQKRQKLINKAYLILAEKQNSLNISPKFDLKTISTPGRSYPTVDAGTYLHLTEEGIRNERLKNMRYPLGHIDQFVDHARISWENHVYRVMRDLIE